jgi:hypothetical protein
MATVAVPAVEAPSLPYRTSLRSGLYAIAAVAAVTCLWALLAFTAVSAAAGIVLLGVAAALLLLDAILATPTRLTVTAGRVTFGWWGRERAYTPDALIVRHDTRRGLLSIGLRKGGRRNGAALARARHADADALAAALQSAGVEVDTA